MTREDIKQEGWEVHPSYSDILVKGNNWCLYGIRVGMGYDATRLKIMDTVSDFILFDAHCTSIVDFNKICKKLKI